MKEFIEKLIGRLEENSFDMSLENPDCKAVWTDKAIEIVNELAEEYSADTPQMSANGWIPCSERLPDKDQRCLINYESKIGYGVDIDTFKGEEFEFFGIKNVTAWQPLPEPYKPQESEWKDKVMKHFTKTE